ncbi:MAG: aldo/keto reductase [Demequinaceae bacterium]|nr:aldo/keto reductase [Demequinaceae bacterium]
MLTTRVARLGRPISAIGLGCWQLGGDWGEVDDERSQAILTAAADSGVTFFDTADVYGDGRSEKSVGTFLASRPDREKFFVATKMGRRANPHIPEAYTLDSFRAWTDRSRQNLGVDKLDLVQLHCPPGSVLTDPVTYENLGILIDEGRVERVGVSVETCEEALQAIGEPRVASVQIILNLFRRKPLERVLGEAQGAGVGIIARVPLASGLLSGRYDATTEFPPNDHRNYNRTGEAFDIGETFSGVPYEVGVEAAREIAALTPPGWTTAQLALRWIVDQGVATVIPGASSPDQARANAAVGDLPPLGEETQAALAEIYHRHIREHVHSRW